MIVIGNTLISEDILENFFVCDLDKCKGACCVEGDLGAPLEKSELKQLEMIYEKVKPYLSEAGLQAIEQQGHYIRDYEGDFSTPTIEGRECAYAVYDKSGILKCGIEQAYLDGRIKFRKPVSCHLYPVRVKKYKGFTAVNYDRWHICDPACVLGKELGVPLYLFLKDALIRKFGREWYEQLKSNAEKIKD
jgi:hypothetical protein